MQNSVLPWRTPTHRISCILFVCVPGAQSAGFYSGVVCERDSLFLPCNLSEIEMTLAFEMFITFINTKLLAPTGASQPLLITLRR